MSATAFPLQWPVTWERSKSQLRSRFKTSLGEARDMLVFELERMKAKNIVISTNIELKQDGMPYANRRSPDDPGVAVYFMLKGKQQCIPCDRWNSVGDNIHAIRLTVEALRGIERWGSGRMVDAAFTGFKALPGATITQPSWWIVLGCKEQDDLATVQRAYRDKAMLNHPDRNGTVEAMQRINQAYDDFKKERTL